MCFACRQGPLLARLAKGHAESRLRVRVPPLTQKLLLPGHRLGYTSAVADDFVARGFIVDAFAERPFTGNPAAVVLLDAPGDSQWMQSVAAEFNLSETAFIEPARPDGVRPLRWFTPRDEVDLCGHATLASGHILRGRQRFTTRSGELVTIASNEGWVEMDFPADPPQPYTPDDDLVGALGGITPTRSGRGRDDVLVELSSGQQVRDLKPDLEKIAAISQIPGKKFRGVIVTAPGDRERIDFVSRCFYPALGVPEDPVTGSAHCALACWWGKRLGSTALVGEQASSRGGLVRVTLNNSRVGLQGKAIKIAETRLLV